MRYPIALILALLLPACGSSDPPTRCQLGRSQPCACPGGGQGAQECGPLGVWSACVCTGPDAGGDAQLGADASPEASNDAAGDLAPVEGGDAPSDAAALAWDVSIDGTPAPRLYEPCTIGENCGAGLECLAVPWNDDAGARGLCTLRCPGDNPGDCPGPIAGSVCVPGVGVGEPNLCARNCAGRDGPDSTRCSSGQRCVRYNPPGVSRAVCAP